MKWIEENLCSDNSLVAVSCEVGADWVCISLLCCHHPFLTLTTSGPTYLFLAAHLKDFLGSDKNFRILEEHHRQYADRDMLLNEEVLHFSMEEPSKMFRNTILR